MEPRILVMDDDVSICKISTLLLNRLGFEVVAVQCGEDAITQYSEALKAERPFMAVILDLTVHTGMGGLEALKKLRAIDPQIVAIMSSGSCVGSMLATYQSHGFKAVLPKPFRAQDISDCLKKLNLGQP